MTDVTTPDPAADPAAAEEARAEAIRELTAAAYQRTLAQEAEREATERVRRAVLAAREAGVSVRRAAALGGVAPDTVDRWWRLRWFWGAQIVVYVTNSRGPSWGSGLVSRITTYTAVGRRADGTPISVDDARAPLDGQPRTEDDVRRLLEAAYPGADVEVVGPDGDETANHDAYDAYEDDDDGADADPDPIAEWTVSVTVREEED